VRRPRRPRNRGRWRTSSLSPAQEPGKQSGRLAVTSRERSRARAAGSAAIGLEWEVVHLGAGHARDQAVGE
jgi:hypothetical protein